MGAIRIPDDDDSPIRKFLVSNVPAHGDDGPDYVPLLDEVFDGLVR